MRATSLRGKITAGYLLSFLLVVLVASALFVGLLAIENQVRSYFGISRFLDTTLEMRRYEKNYLLYRQREDLEAAVRYADSAGALMAAAGGGAEASRRAGWLGSLALQAGPPDPGAERTRQLLQEYQALLRRAGEAPPRDARERLEMETAIRDAGRRITGIAELLSSVEGRNIQDLLRSGRTALILLVVLFLIGTGLIARVVLLTAIRPLKQLETEMQRIASGDYRMLPASRSDEISSLNTAFNRMIRELFQHRQEVIRSERLASLGTMLAGIAHEINNPLSNISTSAEILREEHERAGSRERRDLIDQIVCETDRATHIIRSVLDFSRETRFERRPTDLLLAIRGALDLLRGDVPAHVAVDIDVPPGIEIPADRTKLQQAFINLMSNSIDAMRDAGREGRLSVSARPAGDEHVEIVFQDTGAGIPAHLIDRIFDPFFTTKDVGEGTGLGLYLTHQIVEQHGGVVRAESAVGKGTTVTVRLPRREVGPPPADPQARREELG